MPAVSVVMVFHREVPFLRPAIASVLGQTWSDLELILVDNGAALTPDALGEAGRDPRVRWVRLETNLGIPRGHNAGVEAAHGEFVALLDYDDLALPDRLARQIAALRADPELALVSGFAERIDESDRPLGGNVFCLPDATEHGRYSLYASPLVTPAAMGRREVFAALPYRAEFPFAADLDFQARVTEAWRTAVIPEVLIRYRCYANQTTRVRRDSIERSLAIAQIAAARRRAGQVEHLSSLVAAIGSGSPSGSWCRAAEICLQEKFHLLAAYQARKAIRRATSPAEFTRGLRLALSAIRRTASLPQKSRAARMFLTGPVRTLAVHPAR